MSEITIQYDETKSNYQSEILAACKGYDKVYLSAGTFYVDNMEFIYGNTEIIGASPETTIIKPIVDENNNIVTDKDYVQWSNYSNISFKNITFDGFSTFGFRYLENISFDSCKILNFRDNGIAFRFVNHASVNNCEFDNTGWDMQGDANTVHTNYGFSIKCADFGTASDRPFYKDFTITNNIFRNNKGNACVQFVGRTEGYTVENNLFENSAWNGFEHWESGNMTEQCYIRNNRFYNIGLGEPAATNKSYYDVSGVGSNAIFTKGYTNAIVENNYIENVVENGIEGCYPMIRNNMIFNTGVMENRVTPSTEGIYLSGGSSNEIHVINNYIKSKKYCITTDATNGGGTYPSIYIQGNTFMTDYETSLYINLGQVYNDLVVKKNINLKTVSMWFSKSTKLNSLILEDVGTIRGAQMFSAQNVSIKTTYDTAYTQNNIILSPKGSIETAFDISGMKNNDCQYPMIIRIKYKSDASDSIDALRIYYAGLSYYLKGTNGIYAEKNLIILRSAIAPDVDSLRFWMSSQSANTTDLEIESLEVKIYSKGDRYLTYKSDYYLDSQTIIDAELLGNLRTGIEENRERFEDYAKVNDLSEEQTERSKSDTSLGNRISTLENIVIGSDFTMEDSMAGTSEMIAKNSAATVIEKTDDYIIWERRCNDSSYGSGIYLNQPNVANAFELDRDYNKITVAFDIEQVVGKPMPFSLYAGNDCLPGGYNLSTGGKLDNPVSYSFTYTKKEYESKRQNRNALIWFSIYQYTASDNVNARFKVSNFKMYTDLMEKESKDDAGKTKTENLIIPPCIYTVANDIISDPVKSRNYSSDMYLDHCVKEYDTGTYFISEDGIKSDRVTAYAPCGYDGENIIINNGKNINTEKRIIRMSSDKYSYPKKTMDIISAKSSPSKDQKPIVFCIGDDITDETGISGGYPYWVYARELFEMDKTDGGGQNYDMLTVGSSSTHTLNFEYGDRSSQIKASAQGMPSWTLASILHHSAIRLPSQETWDALGLGDGSGTDYTGSDAQKNLIATTNESSTASDPENVFFDNSKTGNVKFSFAKWLEKYRTCSNTGEKLTLDSTEKGTNIITQEQLDSIDVCLPTHIVISFGKNDVSQFGVEAFITNLQQFIAAAKAEIPTVKIGISIPFDLCGTYFKERYPEFKEISDLNSSRTEYDTAKAIINAFSNKQKENVHLIPFYFCMPTAYSYNLQDISTFGGEKYLRPITGNSEKNISTRAHKECGYQMYAWLKYSMTNN